MEWERAVGREWILGLGMRVDTGTGDESGYWDWGQECILPQVLVGTQGMGNENHQHQGSYHTPSGDILCLV